jgi:hypothetical protein
MCAPWVTWHTSIRYSSFCHSRVKMGASIFFTATMIRTFKSARSRGNDHLSILHKIHVHRLTRVIFQHTKYTLHSNHRLTRVIFQHTKAFTLRAAIFSLHTLASPSGRNVNYKEKQFSGGEKVLSCSFFLCRFRKYVSYGSPIINVVIRSGL